MKKRNKERRRRERQTDRERERERETMMHRVSASIDHTSGTFIICRCSVWPRATAAGVDALCSCLESYL